MTRHLRQTTTVILSAIAIASLCALAAAPGQVNAGAAVLPVQLSATVYRAGQNTGSGGPCSVSGAFGFGDLTTYPVIGPYTFTGWDYFQFFFDFGNEVFVDEVTVVQSLNSGDFADGMKVCYSDTGESDSWVEAHSQATVVGSNTLSFAGSSHRYWVVRSSNSQRWTTVDSIDFSGLSSPVWRIGNYISDDSMETWTLFDNTAFSPWDSEPAFSQSNESVWENGDIGPVCDDRFREMSALVNAPLIVGDPATTMFPFIPPDVRSSVLQTFLWYGGEMFISFTYLTIEDAELRVDLVGPYGEAIPLAEGLTNTDDEWTAWYDSTGADMTVGRYSLSIQVSGSAGPPTAKAAIDAVSVSEADYQHCDYQVTVNDEPPAPGAHTLRSATFVGAEGNLIDNPEFEEVGGLISGWHMPADGAEFIPNSQAGPNPGYVAMWAVTPNRVEELYNSQLAPRRPPPVRISNMSTDSGRIINQATLRRMVTKKYIQVASEAPPPDLRGFTTESAVGMLAPKIFVSFFMSLDMAADVAQHLSRTVAKVENVDTGQVIDISTLDTYTPIDGTTWAQVKLQTVDLPPGRYRLWFINPYPWEASAESKTIYLDKICAGQGQYIVSTDCNMDSLEVLQVLNDVNFANELAAQAQATAIAGATVTAYANAQATQIANAQAAYNAGQLATQTQLAASGNATLIARATQTQRIAMTQTPAAALTSTSFVQGFRATMTAQSAGTLTRVAQVQSTLTQLAQNRGTATANAATQANFQSTLFAQQTSAAQMTSHVSGQATLVVQSTAQVNFNATLQPLLTQHAATQQAAATELASGANATTIFQATQAAIMMVTNNAIMTQQVGIQQTQQAQLTANPNIQSTLFAQGTQIAQSYPTVLPTLQAQSTQQVLQMPPVQPDPAWGVDCLRPTNALNLAWWVEYSVCKVMAWFSWSDFNTYQVTSLIALTADREPFATIYTFMAAMQEINSLFQNIDWDSAQTCDGDMMQLLQPAGELLNGQLDFSGGPEISETCTLPFEAVLGITLYTGLCWAYNFLCAWGLLQLLRWAINIAVVVAFAVYINEVWISKASQ